MMWFWNNHHQVCSIKVKRLKCQILYKPVFNPLCFFSCRKQRANRVRLVTRGQWPYSLHHLDQAMCFFLFVNYKVSNSFYSCSYTINVREYRRGNQKRTIHRNWQHRVHKTKKYKTKNTTQYVLETTMHKQTKQNVNKTCALLPTTGGKDEPNIILMRKP